MTVTAYTLGTNQDFQEQIIKRTIRSHLSTFWEWQVVVFKTTSREKVYELPAFQIHFIFLGSIFVSSWKVSML